MEVKLRIELAYAGYMSAALPLSYWNDKKINKASRYSSLPWPLAFCVREHSLRCEGAFMNPIFHCVSAFHTAYLK